MKNYVHRGDTLTITAPYNVLSGGGVKVGNLFGIAVNTQSIGDSMEAQVKGVFDLAKDGTIFAAGDLVYWDDSAKVATGTVGSNLLIGLAEIAQITGDATVRVKLFGAPGFSGQVNGVKVAHAVYDVATDGGATCTPANSDTIPKNAIVFSGMINVPTALDSAAHGASLAITTAAGSGAGSVLGTTAQATASIDALIKSAAITTPFKMSAAGKLSVVVSGEALTVGKVEVWVLYFLASFD